MPLRACLDPEASNYGFNRVGEFCPDAQSHDQLACEYVSHTIDEEVMAEAIGSEDYTTHEEAEIRGSTPTTDRERNRSSYIDNQTTNKTNLLGIGLIAYLLLK